MQHSTPDKPEVMKIGKLLGISSEAAFGHIFRVWCWADEQSLDGHALDVTEADIDAVARHAGVAQAMRQVGWLEGQDGSISFPNFERHNGESAKKRALATERKREERSRFDRDKSVTREEKRRDIKPLGDKSPESQNPADRKWWLTHEGIDAKGREVGVPPQRGESYPEYKRRIFDHLNAQAGRAA